MQSTETDHLVAIYSHPDLDQPKMFDIPDSHLFVLTPTIPLAEPGTVHVNYHGFSARPFGNVRGSSSDSQGETEYDGHTFYLLGPGASVYFTYIGNLEVHLLVTRISAEKRPINH